jgi:hypothetical protein
MEIIVQACEYVSTRDTQPIPVQSCEDAMRERVPRQLELSQSLGADNRFFALVMEQDGRF